MPVHIQPPPGLPGPRVINYRAVVTRELPLWKLTLTGGDLPESGHVMTSMSYVRLQGDVRDWLDWNERGELNGWVRDLLYDDGDDEDGSGDGCGEGWSLTYDCRWPQEVKDALERYWAARKTIDEASATIEETSAALGEPLCRIHEGLQAGEADVAALVFLPVEEAEHIMFAYRSREDFLRAGHTLEYWRAWFEQRD